MFMQFMLKDEVRVKRCGGRALPENAKLEGGVFPVQYS